MTLLKVLRKADRRWPQHSIVLALTAATLLTTGCASLAPPATPGGAASEAATAQRPYREAIDIGGRLSLRYEQNGSEQALDGKFTWLQTASGILITLLTPFGQTLATID